jgi:hypothetical protein
VHQVGFIAGIYRDARCTKHKSQQMVLYPLYGTYCSRACWRKFSFHFRSLSFSSVGNLHVWITFTYYSRNTDSELGKHLFAGWVPFVTEHECVSQEAAVRTLQICVPEISQLYIWDERTGIVQMKNRNTMHGISFQQWGKQIFNFCVH